MKTGLDIRFHLDRGDFRLDLDLRLPGRGVTAVVGASGCGKTTLLRAIAGLEHDPRGYLRIGDTLWQDGDHFVPVHRRSLGFVFQEASLFAHLDVRQNLQYGWSRRRTSAGAGTLDDILQLLGIGHLLDRRPDSLSGGERQRVAIARALSADPGILLLDEPLAALDRERKQEILPYLQSLRERLDIPVLYVSHSPDEVAQLADHLLLLDAGRAVGNGAIAAMLTRLDLPLARQADAEALIEAVVAGHDEKWDLTYLAFAGGRFVVPRRALPAGRKVRLRVAARDVSLTLEHQSDTSILNIFPAVVDQLAAQGQAQVMVRLLAADTPLLSRITRKSAEALRLRPGSAVFAQVKSVALLA